MCFTQSNRKALKYVKKYIGQSQNDEKAVPLASFYPIGRENAFSF